MSTFNQLLSQRQIQEYKQKFNENISKKDIDTNKNSSSKRVPKLCLKLSKSQNEIYIEKNEIVPLNN